MKKIILWASLTVFLIALVYFLIPAHIYQSLLYLIAIAGSLAIGICVLALYLLITDYIRTDGGKKKENENKEDSGYEGYLMTAVFLICLFGGGYQCLVRETNLVKEELEKNGVFTFAKIVDGSSFSARKLDLSHIEVAFTLENGQLGYTSISIPKSFFNRLHQDQEIPIVYSKRHLSVNTIITTPEELARYQNKENPNTKTSL
jgi:hypothetical protein